MPWCVLVFALALLAMPCPGLAGDTTHIVRPGDNPAALAKRYRVSVAAILARNQGLDPCRLKVGDALVIPEAPAAATAPAAPGAPGAPGTSGPPPAPAAARPAVPPKNLALPDEETPGQRYVVAPGDCPAAIAERFGIPLAVLTRANPGLDPKKLPVGCVLTVPEGNACAPPPVPVTRPGESGSAAPLVMDFQ
ncbi:LysM peptidoglycan-binding domain-containing protein [Desulfovibrio sp. TomC]|uniref:LysM peptidoglycan-binding domain-containing protein n=1 Tax=Desulfovibrio sp. TomC TaxID=1562888 RepID=UPI0005737F2E|nr:LysM domain-containing protein [Desulfovibrio sp. TomC]KHK00853.1 N-acetylmuramoyl-L-alanine amidase AmiB precursor [Desulfovibrio sp. TomC]